MMSKEEETSYTYGYPVTREPVTQGTSYTHIPLRPTSARLPWRGQMTGAIRAPLPKTARQRTRRRSP